MKRFTIMAEDGTFLKLYYPTMEVAQEHYPNAKISECHDQSHIEYINKMLASADEHKTMERKGSIVHVLRFNTSVGTCIATLHQDASDGVWYDFCKYQLWKNGALVVPVTFTLTTPDNFCKEFIFPTSEYTVLCSGKKVQKPQELKGIRKFASVPFDGKSQCQLFLSGDDLYINHSDYFSQMWRPPADDIGKPTSYYMKKYFGVLRPEKFIYADSWGAIVIRNRAWLQITNFVQLVKHLNSTQVATTVWPMIRQFHHWATEEYNLEWERFLEAVAKVTQKYTSEIG